MKCNNCNKEIMNNQNYCEFCGECLVDENNANINIDTTASDEMNARQVREAKELLKKNKLFIAIAAAAIILVIGAVFVFGYIKSKPLSESEIKDSLVGQTIWLNSETIELTDKNISNIKVVSRSTEKKSKDEVLLELKVKYKKATIYLDYNAIYYYNSDKKEWTPSNLYVNSIQKLETKDNLDDVIINEIKGSETIYNSYDYYSKVYGYQVSDVSNISYEGKAENRDFTADIELSNGVYTTVAEIEGSAYFDFSKMKWSVTNIEITDISEAKENKKVDEDLLLKVAKEYLRDEYAEYKYKVDDKDYTMNLYISSDMITEIKINNYTTKDSDNQLRLEIEGKAESGVINNIEFTGVLMIPLKIGEDSDTDSEIEITKVEIEAPDLDLIKEGILDEKVGSDKIKLADAETFAETSRYDKYMDNIYVNGTITLNGESKVVQVRVTLKNSYDKDASWEVYSIVDEKSYGFRKFE